jgi:hypothetical protein
MVVDKAFAWSRAVCCAFVVMVLPGCVVEHASRETSEAQESVAEQKAALGSFNVLTRSYDNQRTAANLSETLLNASNVNQNTFGKLFEMQVDDQVYAQPLYASSVVIPGLGTHNVLYVATVNNSIYAFDADSGALLWSRNYNVTGGRAPRNNEVAHGQACGGNYRDFLGNIGLVGTPVIDGSTGTMYFVTRSLDGGTTMVYRKMAVDIRNGNHKLNSPQPLFTPSGTQPAAFDPWYHNQRAGLALASGRVYVSFAAYCDAQPYHGFMVAFPASNLASQQTGIFNATPTGGMAGIWQAGNAPPIDSSGNVYAMTGNGTFDNATNFGESLVKLSWNTLTRSSSMTPSNYVDLNNADDDFGSAGPAIYSSLSYILGGGKDGRVYARPLGGSLGGIVNVSTGYQAVNTTIVAGSHHIHNGLVLWTGPSGASVYVWGENDFLRRYLFSPTGSPQLVVPATGAAGSVLPPWGMPGGILSLSANGAQSGTGIVWATTPSQGNANQATTPGVLRAFNAETLQLLWDSNRNPGDDIYELSKFNPPVVANGRVYMASFSGVVSAFGIRSGPAPSLVNGVYQIRTSTTPGKCVDVNNSGTADGTNVWQWTCNGSNAQRWQFVNIANDIYEIRTLVSGKCLDVSGSGTADGSNVQEWSCNGSNAQRWRAVALGNSRYQLMPQTAADKCLDVSGSGTADGSNVQEWTCNGTVAQSFTLALDNDAIPSVPNATYRIGTVVADKCVDVSNGDPFDGTNVWQWICNGTDAQRWRFKHLGSGVYEIRAAVSDECLDVSGGGTASGTDVWQWTCNGTNAQRWYLAWAGAGQYQFLPQLGAGTCLDVSGGGTADGTNVQEWACNGTPAQLFRVMAP